MFAVFDHVETTDTRKNAAMRDRITQLTELEGWSITGRDPVRLSRGHLVKQVRGGVLIDG